MINGKIYSGLRKDYLLSGLLLFLFWLAISLPDDIHSPIWGKNLFQHAVVGIILTILVIRIMKKPLFTLQEIKDWGLFSVGRFFVYIIYLIGQILISGIDVARRIMRKDMQIQPHLVEISVPLKDEIQLTINANSITLTPGTITVDVKPEVDGARFLVHCISSDSARQICETGGFVQKILNIYGQGNGNV